MKKSEITILSKCDQLPLSVAIFIPETEIKGIVQISHGMSEHKGRYYNFMEYLANQGYIAIINDHRGHGKSVKKKDDLGYFYDNTSEFIVEDLHQITLFIKEKYPNKKIILLGHSMGSMVVRKYIKKYDSDIDKLIICGSPSKNSLVDVGIFITHFMEIFLGDRHRSNFLQTLALKKNNHKVENKNTASLNAWVCTNPESVKLYDYDELCGFTFTLNGFENLFKLMKDIYDENGWSMKNKDLPIFFIAGSDDPIIVSKDKWLESQNFLKILGYTNVKGKLYPNLRHELLNEKNNQEIYNDIIKFIEK